MEAREFRNTLGHFATGVTVITTTLGEEFIGMTANAFSSLSIDPPLILVCIDKRANTMKALKENHPFVVNILQEEQQKLSSIFATRSIDKFSHAPYSISEAGVPILDNNLATIECTVHNILEGGDHYIVTGLVTNASYNETMQPLLFFRGQLGPIFQEDMLLANKRG